MKNDNVYKSVLDNKCTAGVLNVEYSVKATDDNCLVQDKLWSWSHVDVDDEYESNTLTVHLFHGIFGQSNTARLYELVFALGVLNRLRNKLRALNQVLTYSEYLDTATMSVCETQERLNWLCDQLEHPRIPLVTTISGFNASIEEETKTIMQLKYFPYEYIQFDLSNQRNLELAFESGYDSRLDLVASIIRLEFSIKDACSRFQYRQFRVLDMAHILSINEVL